MKKVRPRDKLPARLKKPRKQKVLKRIVPDPEDRPDLGYTPEPRDCPDSQCRD